jgi:hypothetical protein
MSLKGPTSSRDQHDMRTPQHLRRSLVMACFALGLTLAGGCGGLLDTGTATAPDKHKPAADGSCTAQQTACGTDAFAVCVDLQADPDHCGTCDHACTPGIACQAGVCQQTVCASNTSPFSGKQTTGPVDWNDKGRQVLADVNGDGLLDLVVWQFDPNNGLKTFRASLATSGGFTAPTTYLASFEVAEILPTNANDDGADDLFVFARSLPGEATARVEVWLGGPNGVLSRARTDDLGAADTSHPEAIAVGDISGDGWSDLVTASSSNARELRVFLSDSTGALHPSQTYTTAGGWAVVAFFVRDWDQDGRPDLVVLDGEGLEVLYNRGNGTFEPPLTCAVLLPVVYGLGAVMEDFNHDGLMDLAFGGNPIRVVLRESECGFAPFSSYQVPTPASVAQTMGAKVAGGGVPLVRAADMNGDGQLDLVATFDVVYNVPLLPGDTGPLEPPVDGDTFLSVLLGNPDGTFQLQDTVVSLGSTTITDLAIGETSGDQRPDVVVAGADGQTKTWANTCQ